MEEELGTEPKTGVLAQICTALLAQVSTVFLLAAAKNGISGFLWTEFHVIIRMCTRSSSRLQAEHPQKTSGTCFRPLIPNSWLQIEIESSSSSSGVLPPMSRGALPGPPPAPPQMPLLPLA